MFDTAVYGGPLNSGYPPGEITFALAAILPNLWYLPAHLIAAMPMLVLGLAAVAWIARRRVQPGRTDDARRDFAVAVALAASWFSVWGLYAAYTWTASAAIITALFGLGVWSFHSMREFSATRVTRDTGPGPQRTGPGGPAQVIMSKPQNVKNRWVSTPSPSAALARIRPGQAMSRLPLEQMIASLRPADVLSSPKPGTTAGAPAVRDRPAPIAAEGSRRHRADGSRTSVRSRRGVGWPGWP